MIIDDGTGHGYQAGVAEDGRLLVDSITTPHYASAAKHLQQLFIWESAYSATAADVVIYIKNIDSTNFLRIHRVITSSSVAQLWTFSRVTAGTAGGTTITAVNTNFASGKTALATSYGNAAVTGSLTKTVLQKARTPASSYFAASLEGSIMLPVNTAICVVCSATGDVEVNISGWFESLTHTHG